MRKVRLGNEGCHRLAGTRRQKHGSRPGKSHNETKKEK